MTTLREAAAAALEVLDAPSGTVSIDQWVDMCSALRAALAEPEQDTELAAALGWPGGVSTPILDRHVLLDIAAKQRSAALAEQPEPPPEAQTEAEQRAYTFGWFKALEKSREMQEALQIIATPQRPDGTWNRDREACRQLAAEVLGFHNKGEWK